MERKNTFTTTGHHTVHSVQKSQFIIIKWALVTLLCAANDVTDSLWNKSKTQSQTIQEELQKTNKRHYTQTKCNKKD